MKVKKRRYTMTLRAEKAVQTRSRILDAALAAYREKPIEEFTLDEVARRAETTVQTVLRAFGSKENLIMSALTALVGSETPLRRTPPGDVPAAIAAFFDIYESIGDVVIARLADERRLPALKVTLDEGRAGHREAVAQMFAPYLKRNDSLHDALTVITDVYVWKMLRRDRGLDRTSAQAIVTRLAHAAIEEYTHGKNTVAQLVGRRKPASKSGHRPNAGRTRS